MFENMNVHASLKKFLTDAETSTCAIVTKCLENNRSAWHFSLSLLEKKLVFVMDVWKSVNMFGRHRK